MNNLLYLFIVISLAIAGCKENSNPVDSNDTGSLVVSGKISDFTGYFNKVYTYPAGISDSAAIIYSDINNDGSFKISIPIPPESHLSVYTPLNQASGTNGDSTILTDSIRIAAKDLKYASFGIFALSNSGIVYALPVNLAGISKIGECAKTGDFFISYYYFNTATKIQGYYKWRVVVSDSSREIITEFNVNTKAGWNKLITKFISESSNRSVYEVSDIEDDHGIWIIGARDSFSNAVRRF